MRSAFTLIELLVVIAIIAVLSVVVVLSLNPAELLRQSRDANRLSDLSTLNSALALYTTDQAGISGFPLGNASSVYVSLPDSSSTCGTWNLPTLPAGYTYNCVTSTSSKNINTTGWIPVNFSSISGGAPFSNLPLDGVNQSSSGLYYTYYSNGSQFIVTAIPESQKQKAALGAKSTITNYPDVMANGSSMTISPLWSTNGLVGYWSMDEGAGTSAADQSGSGNAGSLCSSGSCPGTTPPSWTSGKIGNGALTFDGTTNYINKSSTNLTTPQVTFCVWVKYASGANSNYPHMVTLGGGDFATLYVNKTYSKVGLKFITSSAAYDNWLSSAALDANWHHLCGSYDGSTVIRGYTDGIPSMTLSASGTISYFDASVFIGSSGTGSSATYFFSGSLDDVRVYNRVLSPAEIQAIYNAEK